MKARASRYARVKVVDASNLIQIPVSTGKPPIPEPITNKWQYTTDLIARLLNVTACTMTVFSEQYMSISIVSRNNQQLFTAHETIPSGSGYFCETVAGNRAPLTITDTKNSVFWDTPFCFQRGIRSYYGIPISWSDGEVFGTLSIHNSNPIEFSSIATALLLHIGKYIEDDLMHLIETSDARKQLSQKEMLIKEIHHRINNQFTLLISYIELQTTTVITNENISDILTDIQNRIRSIAIIHEKLSFSLVNDSIPSLDEYLSHLCNCLISTVTHKKVSIFYEIAPLELPIEPTVSIGLIITELITNSIKHAFVHTEKPQIHINASHESTGLTTIVYSDNGIGLPINLSDRQNSTLGMHLITMQVKQLNGQLDFCSNNGAEFRITFRS